jgi:hypothetical protein
MEIREIFRVEMVNTCDWTPGWSCDELSLLPYFLHVLSDELLDNFGLLAMPFFLDH